MENLLLAIMFVLFIIIVVVFVHMIKATKTVKYEFVPIRTNPYHVYTLRFLKDGTILSEDKIDGRPYRVEEEWVKRNSFLYRNTVDLQEPPIGSKWDSDVHTIAKSLGMKHMIENHIDETTKVITIEEYWLDVDSWCPTRKIFDIDETTKCFKLVENDEGWIAEYIYPSKTRNGTVA